MESTAVAYAVWTLRDGKVWHTERLHNDPAEALEAAGLSE